jgi:DNA-binding CsgD family transcriptional regulator
MLRSRGKTTNQHRFTYGIGSSSHRYDARTVNLAFELLCNAFPTGAIVLDSRCGVIFSNKEGIDLLRRWSGERCTSAKASVASGLPPEIVAACDRLRFGRKDAGRRTRPTFGGRIYLRHPQSPSLSAVIALERSPRDRRVAVFCILVQDRFRDNMAGGRRDQLAMLTIAERRVAKLVAEGMRNSDIAASLGKSTTTVKSQLAAVFAKLQIGSRTQLAAVLRSA